MSFNRVVAPKGVLSTEYVKKHLSSLASPNVPNYTVSANAAGSLLFLYCVSALNGCGSATTNLALGLGVMHGLMFVNQNWERSCEVASNSLEAITGGLSSAVTTIKENKWVQHQYHSMTNGFDSFFGSSRANMPVKVDAAANKKEDNEASPTPQLKMTKTD